MDKFPIYSYEWWIFTHFRVLSSEYGIRDKYNPQIISKTDTLLVDNTMVSEWWSRSANLSHVEQIGLLKNR